MSWETNSNYYSGQGVVMLGDRDPVTGKGKNFLPVGNVSSLKLNVATSVLEHKEAQTGARGIDLRLTTEVKGGLSMVLENFNAANLAVALRGTVTSTAGGTVTDEANTGYLGRISALANAKVSAVTVKRGATSLTAYTNDATPYDYKVNLDSGSIQLNDSSIALLGVLTTGGTAPSAIAVGSTTSVTVANTAAVGSKVVFSGFAGADAALINNKVFTVVTASPTVITINLDSSGKTITTGTPLSFFDGGAITVTYTYGAQSVVGALTGAASEKYLRFEGLNTADNNKPVIIEVFRFLTDPLKELEFIGDGVGQFTLDGSMLLDTVQSGSKYFKQTLVA